MKFFWLGVFPSNVDTENLLNKYFVFNQYCCYQSKRIIYAIYVW